MSKFDKRLHKYAPHKVLWSSNNYFSRRRRLQVLLFLALLTLKIKMIWANLSVAVTKIVQIKVHVNLLSSLLEEKECWRMTTDAAASPLGTNSSPWIFGSGELKILLFWTATGRGRATWLKQLLNFVFK
jgi:hypothetical protein